MDLTVGTQGGKKSEPNMDVNHLSVARLRALSIEAVVTNPQESQHLKTCYQCMQILQRFAEQRRKSKDGEIPESQSES